MGDYGFNVRFRLMDGTTVVFYNVTEMAVTENNVFIDGACGNFNKASIPMGAIRYYTCESTDLYHNEPFPFTGAWKND